MWENFLNYRSQKGLKVLLFPASAGRVRQPTREGTSSPCPVHVHKHTRVKSQGAVSLHARVLWMHTVTQHGWRQMDGKAGASLGEDWASSPGSELIHAALHWDATSVISACGGKGTQSEEFRSPSPRARHCPKHRILFLHQELIFYKRHWVWNQRWIWTQGGRCQL